VAGRFLCELHPGGQPEFGVDVREVGLHGAWRDEKPCGDVVIGQPFADQLHHLTFGRGERRPAVGGPFALTTAALRVRDRLLGGQGGAIGLGIVEVLIAQRITQRRDRGLIIGIPDLESGFARALPDGLRSAE
jgi:hypothetical protein